MYTNKPPIRISPVLKGVCAQQFLLLIVERKYLNCIENLLFSILGKLTEQEVRNNIKPLMHTRMRLGEFDPPEMVPFTNISMSVIQSEVHRELAVQASAMSFVLLKNLNGALPIVDKIPALAVSPCFIHLPVRQFLFKSKIE